MEEFKSLDKITEMDEKHRLMGAVCGSIPSLERMHKCLSREVLNKSVPPEIQNQFNIARNMALYSYYFYALSPEVHLRTYTIIERALKIRAGSTKRHGLKYLIELAVEEGWIADAGFRHIENPDPGNHWCRSMIKVISELRNSQAHGGDMLLSDCLHHISVCADFINQLFPDEKNT
ncbi:MAG TPA: hypothetical protein ENJ35_10360 [Gammaproteobacteria bacterium]|nr:hypothetical protein [Gammaproteobacteria bacterium]